MLSAKMKLIGDKIGLVLKWERVYGHISCQCMSGGKDILQFELLKRPVFLRSDIITWEM